MRSVPYLMTILVCLLLFIGWRVSRFNLINAEDGVGYILGIVGGTLMLLLLIYPLRKRKRNLKFIGSTKMWFRIHMFCGVYGPLIILYHSNFSLGSLNSSVALFSMLLVAVSGVFGRYVYVRIHSAMTGKKIEIIELRKQVDEQGEGVETALEELPEIKKIIFDFADYIKHSKLGLLQSIILRFKKRKTLQQVGELIKYSNVGKIDKVKLKKKMNNFLNQSVILSRFDLYRRLFSLWHVFHLPIFFMMVIAVIVHIIAVHLY